MNGKLFFSILAISAIAGAYMGATRGVPAPEDDHHFALMAEADYHCERLGIESEFCGNCERMSGADKRRCNNMKTAVATEFEKYLRHNSLTVLQREVDLYLSPRPSANSMADKG